MPVIVHNHKFVGLADEGKDVLKWARKLLANRTAMLDELAILIESRLGTIRIGAMLMSSPVLPFIVSLFAEKYPEIHSDIQIIGRDVMGNGLLNFEFDIGITYIEQPIPESLNFMPLYKEKF